MCTHIADSLYCTAETNNIIVQLESNLKKEQNKSIKSERKKTTVVARKPSFAQCNLFGPESISYNISSY